MIAPNGTVGERAPESLTVRAGRDPKDTVPQTFLPAKEKTKPQRSHSALHKLTHEVRGKKNLEFSPVLLP